MLHSGLLIIVLIIPLGIGVITLPIITHGIHSQFLDIEITSILV